MPSIKPLLVVVVCLVSATRVTYAKDVPGSGAGVPASRLSGRVVDRKHGGPVEGALVQITDGSARELTAVTDRAGRYAFDVTYPAFRDCSKLDMSRMEHELWVARP